MAQLLYIPLFLLVFIISVVIIIVGIKKRKQKLVFGTIIFFIVFLILIFVSRYYIFEKRLISKQVVDITALRDFRLNKNLESLDGLLIKYEISVKEGLLKNEEKQPDGIKEEIRTKLFEEEEFKNISVSLILFYSEEEADKYYELDKNNTGICPIEYSDCDFNGKYSISYVEELRNDPEGGGLPSGIFNSFVTFKKKNLIITIGEHAENKYTHEKDKVIKIMMDRLVKKIKISEVHQNNFQ